MLRAARADVDAERLGRALNVLLAERRMSRRELANRSGVSYGHLSSIAHGQRNARVPTLMRITKALGVELQDLIDKAQDLPELQEEGTHADDE